MWFCQIIEGYMRNKTILITTSILVALFAITTGYIAIMILNYTPKELGPAAITFWFVAVLIAITCIVTLVDFLLKLRNEDKRLEPRKVLINSLRTGFLLGFTSAILLALSSLKSLSIRDIILFALTVLLIELYFRTRKT